MAGEGLLFLGTAGLLPRWVFGYGARASGIRRCRVGTDNNPFRGLARIAMAIQRIPLLVSHE